MRKDKAALFTPVSTHVLLYIRILQSLYVLVYETLDA